MHFRHRGFLVEMPKSSILWTPSCADIWMSLRSAAARSACCRGKWLGECAKGDQNRVALVHIPSPCLDASKFGLLLESKA